MWEYMGKEYTLERVEETCDFLNDKEFHLLMVCGETSSRTTHTTMNCKESDRSNRPYVSICMRECEDACMCMHVHADGWNASSGSSLSM